MMYLHTFLSWISFLIFASGKEIFKEKFTTLDDRGRELMVSTSGRLRRTIDLNNELIVAKTMCKESLVKVSLASKDCGEDWRIGDVVVGNSALNCRLSFTNPGEGLLGKIAYIEKKREGLLYLTIEKTSPLDILEEAKLSVHVNHRRSKRSNTNFLSNILDSIDWLENSNTSLKLNEDIKPFSILKLSNHPEPEVGMQNIKSQNPNTENEFNFTCFSCFGTVDLSYHLEMQIERDSATNNPIVKSYLSQIEGEADNTYDFSIESHREQTILVEKNILETGPIFLPPITLATFKRFPPIQLRLSVNSTTLLKGDIVTHSSKDLSVKDRFQTSGKFVISNEHFQTVGSPTTHLSTYDWRTLHNPSNNLLHSNDQFSINISISHEIFVNPFIEWNERDIRMDFGSPFTVRLNQEVNLASSLSDYSLCTEMESRITSVFFSGRNSLIVDAFGFQKWGEVSTLTAAEFTNVTLDQMSLSKNCHANCFEPQLLSLSPESCGSPGIVVFRNSSTFSSLRKLFGNLILFASEEYSESTWCGQPGNPCLDCSDYLKDDNVCSDRYVTPELAEVLTRLAKLISAEWTNRKLLILEGWDEPTSFYPYGRHGNESLFYTGRAARIGLSKNLTSQEPERDEIIFRRFLELVQCSDVDFFKTIIEESILDICVSDQSPSFLTNQEKKRKKRALKSNNIVKVNSWKEDKDKYNDRIFDLVSAKTLGSTIKDYFGGEKYHPRKKTADDTCGRADELYNIDNVDQMQRQIQYPLEDVEFEAEGPKTSSCGMPTRGCNQCDNYRDVENPWDWCLTRTMTTRAATRLHRLATLVMEETESDPTPDLTDVEEGVCRSGMVLFEHHEKCVENMPSRSTDKETKCYACIKDARCCYLNNGIGCMKKDCFGEQSTSMWTKITCSEPNPFSNGVTIPATPACNQGDTSKMILYENVCGGDPCQFFTGKEYHLLLKVVLIFEVCSGKWDQTTMDQDIQNLNTRENDLMSFLRSCMGNDETILKIHFPVPNDPTIGIGFSLREFGGSSEKKDLLLTVLPNLDYDQILNGKQSITKEQALYLFDKTMRRYYIKTINSIVPFKTFVHLDTATKIALVNANYRGEFPSKLKKKFNTAVVNNQWGSAVAIYLSHPDYQDNRCSTNGRSSICTRMKWNAEQFRKNAIKQVRVLRRESYSKVSLQNVGRSLKLKLKSGLSLSVSKFANLAVLAGFDHVTKEADHIVVCVRTATGVNNVVVNYPNLNMHETEPPIKDMLEYEIPAEADYSLTYPLLLDGHNDTIKLSDCYKISDIKSRKFRYFRFDPKLLECLEDASSVSSECVKVIPGSGYRVKSANNRNIDLRHRDERWRFSVGMAVELGKGMTTKQLETLGLTVFRSCIQNLIRRRLILGMGAHSDRLYVDIRESTSTEEFLKVWDAGSPTLYEHLKNIGIGFYNGGVFIEPTNKTRACQPPPLGPNAYYIKYSNEGSCADIASSSLCLSTTSTRSKAATDLLKRLEEVTGNGPIDKATLREKVNKCLVKLCGGCIGKGKIWKEKTIACFDFIKYFLDGSSTPFPDLKNAGAFFNTQNTKSEVHYLACHEGSVCIEKIQLHSLLQETLTTRYKPDVSQTNEELVFDPMDNPSPLLDILEQEMAMRVSGNVSVYIENNGDISRLNHKIKILMTYNRKVTHVHYHLTKSVRKNQALASVQRKIERWASSLCPDNARVTVAPFTVKEISQERHKRSIDKSADRNIAKQLRNNWELEWLSKT